MLAILWLIVWATVGDAFYDDYNWYTSDDGVTYGVVESQKVIRENFSDFLRSFADSYNPKREGDEELTLPKVKSRLRMVKVFTHTGNSNDFEPSKGQVLPLHEGGKFCTMGRHTKVDCNHCTCVAGQLYMCTGMICHKAPAKPRPLITCIEGKRRKIDSCNYCYCRNGHEICSTRDCRLQHDHLLLRSQYTCHEGERRKVACNRCICRNGEEYCTKTNCSKKKPTQLKLKLDNQTPEGHCNDGQSLKIHCRVCKCTQNRWRCSDKNCNVKKKPEKLLWAKCREGTTRQIDACNTCYCHLGREFCEKKVCDEEEHLDFLRRRQHCDRWDVKYEECNRCECLARQWVCTQKLCESDTGPESETGGDGGLINNDNYFYLEVCNTGHKRKLDDCNTCFCRGGQWYCQIQECKPAMQIPEIKKSDIIKFLKNLDEQKAPVFDNIFEQLETNEYGDNTYPDPNNNMNMIPIDIMDDFEFLYPKISENTEDNENIGLNGIDIKLIGRFNWESTVPDEEQEKPVEEQSACKRGSRKKIACNKCYCRKGLWLCQDKDCGPDIATLPPNCKKGDKIIVDCVPCKCRRRAWKCYIRKKKGNCKPDEKKPPPPELPPPGPAPDPDDPVLRMTYSHNDDDDLPKKCNIGERYRVDSCNYCYCNAYRERVCSDNKCTNPQLLNGDDRFPMNVSEQQCKIGSRFRKGECNYCYCNYDRHLVCSNNHCTRKLSTGLSDDTEVLRFTPAPKICLRNERFRIDNCNWCYCNATRHRICERQPCNRTTPDRRWPPNQPRRGCFIGSRFEWGKCGYCYCTVWRKIDCLIRYNCTDDVTTTTRRPIKGPKQSTRPRSSSNFECELGQIERIDDCNFCRCTISRKWMCSNNVCPSNNDHPGLSDEKEIRRFTPAPKVCLPDERFRIDNCNWCYCNATRHRICERQPCNRRKPDTRWPPNQPRKGCYIGSRFEWGKCGYCYCSVWRKIVCRIRYNCTEDVKTKTRKPSINATEATKQSTRPRRFSNFECEVGQIERIDDCNFCRCTISRKWMCSNNVCPSNYDHHNLLLSKTKLCADGIRRQVDECNYCVCHSGVEFCTQKHCLRGTGPTIFPEPECVVGDPVPALNSCNLCFCLNSDILCTDNPCIQRQSTDLLKSSCVEGLKYRMNDGCNFCLCQGGQEFCTKRACLVHDDVGSDSAGCNEGEVTPAEDRCNMCVCMRGKINCTNRKCNRRKLGDAISENLLSYIRTQKIKKHKTTKGTKRRCSPGQKYFPDDFDPNCPNDCICDRHELLCTKRKCFNNWDKKTPFKWPLGRVEKKNRNSKQYLKQDCDDYQKLQSGDPCISCMCLNGRKVCTIVNCSDDNDGEPGAIEALINNNPRGGKGNKGNMKMKKKHKTFCVPFTFFSPDNNRFCRNCFCLHNGLALCLLNLCKYSKDIPHQNSPEELDEVCTPGETGYPTKCVTCTCSLQGKWICTREELALCQERNCDEKDEFHMGFFPYCAGCKCSIKEWFCSIQSEACSDYSNATCPLGSFIRNPRQHCSICLCGGYEEGSHNMCFTEAKCVRQVSSQLK